MTPNNSRSSCAQKTRSAKSPAAIWITSFRNTRPEPGWVHAGHTLLHDLKENVVTPYVMVESLGWFYGLPIFGKTLLPSLYRRWTAWLRRLFVPSLATTLTVDKLAPAETAEMLAAEQQAIVRKALHERIGLRSSRITPALVEGLRQRALSGQGDPEPPLIEAAKQAGLSTEALDQFRSTACGGSTT